MALFANGENALGDVLNWNKIFNSEQLITISNGPNEYDLHTETYSKILIFPNNAQSLLNKPPQFTDDFAIYIRLASHEGYHYVNWGTTILIDPHNNRIFIASDYSNRWSDWKEI